MKTPEDVSEFLEKHFSRGTLYPTVEGFARFLCENKNFLELVLEKILDLQHKEVEKLDKNEL